MLPVLGIKVLPHHEVFQLLEKHQQQQQQPSAAEKRGDAVRRAEAEKIEKAEKADGAISTPLEKVNEGSFKKDFKQLYI